MSYDPRKAGARCDECPLKGLPVVPAEANLSPLERLAGKGVCIIGEAPGEQEEKIGRPFVGPSGSELDMALRMAGIKRREAHITNVMLCRPPGNKLQDFLRRISKINKERAKDDKPPIPTPMECCAPRLEEEMAGFQHFITLGKTAMTAVTGQTASIMAVRGGMADLEATERTPPRKVMPTVHPAFVLRMPRWKHVFRNDIFKAGKWFRGQADWVPPNVIYHPSPAALAEFLSNPARVYTFDIETDGIESLTANIRCIAIGDENDVMVVGLLGRDGKTRFYPPGEERKVVDVMRRFFENPAFVKAGHNAGYYDKIVLQQQWGIDPRPILDTILLHRCVESELPHGLAFVGSMYTEAPAWKCYDPETEVLTKYGWVKFPELEKGVAVAQWEEGRVSFVKPRAYVNQLYTGKIWKLTDQATDLLITPDHGMIYKPAHNPKTCRPEHANVLKRCMVQDLPKTGYLPHVGTMEGGQEVASGLVQLVVAAQADGSWQSPERLRFGFTKKRKVERLRSILVLLGIPFRERKSRQGAHEFFTEPHPAVVEVRALLGQEKQFGPWLLDWSLPARQLFLSELPLWDGTATKGHTNYNSVSEVNADWVQAVAVISNQAARKYEYANGEHQPILRVSLPGGKTRRREWSKLENLKREEVDYDGRVYCVSVPAGFLVVRRGGNVTIAQNTDREGNKLSHDSESDAQLHEYCANDVAVTARVLRPLADQVRLRAQTEVWKMDQRIQAVCSDMHTVGMYVDQTVRLAEEKRLLARRHELLTQIRDHIGIADFNPGSVYQMREILFEKWSLTPPLDEEDRFTSSGDPSTADLVLRSLLTDRSVLKDHREFIKLVRYYRKVQKVLGTYVVKLRPWNVRIEDQLGWDDEDDWVDRETRKRYGLEKKGIVDPRTGRMHPGYNAHVAVTGRLSSSKPINAQNFPKALRAMVVAAPGHVLVGADMDQLELRIAAARWGVQLYLRAFETGKDPHSMTAFAVFGEAFCQAAGITADQFERPGPLVGPAYINGKFEGSGEAKKMRDLSKAVQYASQYMAKVETVHKLICKTEIPSKAKDGTTELPYALLPLRRVNQMRDNWLKGAPEFPAGWDAEIGDFRRQGYIREDVTGRRRDFLDGEMPNEIVNFPIQASAAGLMNRAILQLHEQIPLNKWGPGTGIINQCHDSIVVECPESEAQKVAAMLEEAMNQTHPSLPGVTFTASAAIGTTWKQVG